VINCREIAGPAVEVSASSTRASLLNPGPLGATEMAVRRAKPDDAAAVVAIAIRSLRESHREVVPVTFFENLDVEALTQRWERAIAREDIDVLVLLDESVGVAGFCCLAASRDSDAHRTTGEITAMHVEPSRWRAGFGSALIAGARDFAERRKFGHVTVWAAEFNSRARRFYEAKGFLEDRKTRIDETLGIPIPSVRYRMELDTGAP
jgi:GNAT superfamily N-acetyltransferase